MGNTTRMVGLGLAGLGILLGLLCSVWSVTQPETAGGRLFALAATAIIVAPLIIAGVVFYRRAAAEESAAAAYSAARESLGRQRLAAGEWARRLDALSGQLDRLRAPDDRLAREAATRLSLLADGLRATPDEVAALDVLAAERPDRLQDLQSADATLDAELVRLEERVAAFARGQADAAAVLSAVDRVNRVFNQRQRLLARGTLPPVPSVAELLAPRRSLAPGEVELNGLDVGDALSYPGHDYLIVGRVEYEDGGVGWLGYRLRDGRQEALLLLEGGRLLLLDLAQAPGGASNAFAAASPLDLEGTTFQATRSGTATASVGGVSGRRVGVLVDYRLYEAAGEVAAPVAWAERFDETGGGWTFWRGEAILPGELDAFPRARDAAT